MTWQGNHHYHDVIMNEMATQIIGVSIVCSTVCPGADQRKYQVSASVAFMGEIHRWPMNSPHKGPVTRQMFPFDDVIVMTGTFQLQKCISSWEFLLYKMTRCAARSAIHISLATYILRYNTSCGKLISKPWYTEEFIGLLRHHFHKSFPLR